MSARLMVCMLLLGASLPVIARDAVTDGGTDAPCPPVASAPQGEPLVDVAGARRVPAASASKAQPAVRGGGDAQGQVRGPRWHSFLPGMFR